MTKHTPRALLLLALAFALGAPSVGAPSHADAQEIELWARRAGPRQGSSAGVALRRPPHQRRRIRPEELVVEPQPDVVALSSWEEALRRSPVIPFDGTRWHFYSTPNNIGFPRAQGSQMEMIPDNRGSAGAVAFASVPLTPPYAVELQYATYDDDGGPLSHSADGVALMFGRNEQSYIAARALPVGGTRAFIPDGSGFGVHMVTYNQRGILITDGHGRRVAFHPTRATYTHGQWATVRVEVEPNLVRVFFNGQQVIEQPMQLSPQFAAFGVAAATGGADSQHLVRNVRIARGQPSPGPGPVIVVPHPGPGPAPAQGELVVNGGFELPGLHPGQWSLEPALPGWQLLSGPAIEVQHRVAGEPAEGGHHVELDSSASSAIYQDLRTRPGARYAVRLAFAARPGTAAESNGLEVRWNGQVIGRATADGQRSPHTEWTRLTFYVLADRPISRLSLHDVGRPDGLGTYIDAVSVQAEP